MSEVKLKHWTGKQLIFFSEFIWSTQNWGWSLLALHSTIWGMKMFDMLKLTWGNILNDDLSIKEEMVYHKNSTSRPILSNRIITRSIQRVLDLGVEIDLEGPIYVNHKRKPLSTSTLNREFNGFIDTFKVEMNNKTGLSWNVKPIKTNTFQIAWALDLLNAFDFKESVFGRVSRYLNHSSVADTKKLLEVESYEDDEFFLMFNYHKDSHHLNLDKMSPEEVRDKFYSIPKTGTELWESEHLEGYPI